MTFNDWFGAVADRYATARPEYPDELYAYLARVAPAGLVWDCACGNGQASHALARYFEAVVATDASERQIAATTGAANLEFRVAPASASGLADRSAALVTVAQALHWFAGAEFYAEATRVLVPGGVLAAWSYGRCRTSAAVDAIVEHLFTDMLGPFWPTGRRYVDEGYASFSLPGKALDAPRFAIRAHWRADDLLAYLSTWSAVGRYRDERGTDPVAELSDEIRRAFPADAALVEWPLVVLAAQKV